MNTACRSLKENWPLKAMVLLGEELLGGVDGCDLERDMGNAGILLANIHENVLVIRHVGGAEQVKNHPGRMLHDNGMALLEADVGESLEA